MAIDIQEIDIYAPHRRQVQYVVEALKMNKVIAYPTDTVYGLGADILSKEAILKILEIKKASDRKLLSFIFSDIKQASEWTFISNKAYKIIKKLIPGPYTFIFPAAKHTPHPVLKKRKTIGIRIPDCPVALAIVNELNRPIVNSSIPRDHDEIFADPSQIINQYTNQIDLFLNGGSTPNIESTIIDFCEDYPKIIREGAGDISMFKGNIN